MFPRLRQRIGTTIIDRIHLMVEFSTLGEYALAEDLRLVAVDAYRPHIDGAATARRTRGDCPWRTAAVSRRGDDPARF
ncbi:MAG: hypothetical protein ACR2J6_05730 [Thermoleophilaceae bacterium]